MSHTVLVLLLALLIASALDYVDDVPTSAPEAAPPSGSSNETASQLVQATKSMEVALHTSDMPFEMILHSATTVRVNTKMPVTEIQYYINGAQALTTTGSVKFEKVWDYPVSIVTTLAIDTQNRAYILGVYAPTSSTNVLSMVLMAVSTEELQKVTQLPPQETNAPPALPPPPPQETNAPPPSQETNAPPPTQESTRKRRNVFQKVVHEVNKGVKAVDRKLRKWVRI